MREKFRMSSRDRKFVIGFGVAFALLVTVAALSPQQPVSKSLNSQNTSSTQSTPENLTPKVTYQTTTETKSIPFTDTNVSDSSLPQGQTKITTVGIDGIETLTYKITHTEGQQTDKQLIANTTTTPPVNQVIHVGTYVAPSPNTSSNDSGCTNGTYVNTAGNTVCSPETAPSVPPGATAKCNDGTYSFSQTHSGTCSHHGGVAAWL